MSQEAATRRPPPPAGVIRDVEQIRALRSPLRQEMLDKARALGAWSIADLAHALGRPADGLYYHVRALLAAGLLEPAGERGEGRRREALFRTPAPGDGLWLSYDPADEDNVAAVTAAVGGMLRLTERTFAAAYQPGAVTAGPRRNLWAARTEGWLSPDEVEQVNRLLHRLRAMFDRPRAEGRELHALTFVIAPRAVGQRRQRRTAPAAAATPAAPPPPAPPAPAGAARPPRRGTRASARRRGR